MFIGFAICPESDAALPLDPADVQIDAICSQHFFQSDSYRAILLQILNVVQGKLGLPHVWARSHPGSGLRRAQYCLHR